MVRLPGAVASFGQATVAASVFVGSQNGYVYSLDAQSCCYYRDYTASAGVRTAITLAHLGSRDVALFGDRRAHVYSLDVATGKTIWKALADDALSAHITGSPSLFEGRLYVPISMGDDSAAVDPNYECCRGRGAAVALDVLTDRQIWKTYTILKRVPAGRIISVRSSGSRRAFDLVVTDNRCEAP